MFAHSSRRLLWSLRSHTRDGEFCEADRMASSTPTPGTIQFDFKRADCDNLWVPREKHRQRLAAAFSSLKFVRSANDPRRIRA
jgi:hypothetical protein